MTAASLVPGPVGAIASAAQAGLDLVQGHYISAGIGVAGVALSFIGLGAVAKVIKAAREARLAKSAESLTVDVAKGGQPFAMGLTDEGLEAFANARGATTWKQLPNPENWKAGVLDKLADPKTSVHFNLDGVDVWKGVQRAASGRGGPTDWELLQIKQNPQFWDSLQFWKGGQSAPNPFK